MKTIESYRDIEESAQGAVIAIGNFDGVHRGHQALLQKAKDIAAGKGCLFGVLTFEPHPRRLFRPDDPPVRLTPKDIKAWRLKEFGVDALFSIPFDWDFASQSAEGFIKNVLVDGLKVSHVVVGYDFRFGQLRKGEAGDIEKAGIGVTVVDQVGDERGEVFSSSGIRQALRHGKIEEANKILGWDWEIWGEVIRGDQRGREIGYPTANFDLGETIHPGYGVYAAQVNVKGEDEWHAAAINIGIRPMFEIPQAQVESYIFDFDREIYGEVLRVRPVRRLRGEAKFESIEALVRQIDLDCAQVREILNV